MLKKNYHNLINLSLCLFICISFYYIFNTLSLFLNPLYLITSSLLSTLLAVSLNKIFKFRYLEYLCSVAVIIALITGFFLVEIQPLKFLLNFPKAFNILGKLLTPDLSIFFPMLKQLIQTIYLAFMATVLAIPFAFVLSFFAARNLMPKTPFSNCIYYLTRTISTFTRSIEAIVWAIIFTVWVGIGPFAGMLALWVHSIASLVKLYSEQIENIDHGPVEAVQATGANTLQVWIFSVIPQILSPFLAFTIYRWDINIRMATIVGFVGGGGIGQALQQQQQLLRWHNVSTIMLMIAVTVWIMDILSGKIREYLLRK